MTVPQDANIHQLGLLPPHWPDMAEVAQRLPRWDLHEILPGQCRAPARAGRGKTLLV
jgi:hypothetical protein